jgi:signal transduction histidine kinase
VSNTDSGVLQFEASAKLQRLLGRDLLPDEYSAVEELVKNAYDSNATQVIITIVRPSNGDSGVINILDNGEGLTLAKFRLVWMWAGFSEKTAEALPRTGRIPIGEKGIGRFAADKLGEKLIVFTKTRNQARALRVVFDWKRFGNQKKRLSEIDVPYDFVDQPLLGRDASGTVLRIEGLRQAWDDDSLLELRTRLARLLNPFGQDQEFRIVLNTPKPAASGELKPIEIGNANFEWVVSRDEDSLVSIKRRRRNQEDGKWGDWEGPDEVADEDENVDFGPIDGHFLYFINRPKKGDVNGAVPGVGVYRDGLRVEPAGSADADWLGLLAKRAKRAGHMPLVPSRLFGFVQIGRETNPKLQDATNRRAFIRGPEFEAFARFLKNRLSELEVELESRIAKPRWEESRRKKNQKLIQASQRTLSVLSLGLAHELRQPLTVIYGASENIATRLSRAGVTLPEVDDSITTIQRNVDRMDKHIRFLKDLGERREETESVDLNALISEVVEEFEVRTAARGISLHSSDKVSAKVTSNRWSILMALTNLMINAYEAIVSLDRPKGHNIYVRVSENRNAISIAVEDDGPGVPEALRERVFRRETTSKQGGMGVALIMYREALRVLGGDLSCESFQNPTRFAVTVPRKISHDSRSAG